MATIKQEIAVEKAFSKMHEDDGLGKIVLTPEGRLPPKIKENNVAWIGFRDGYLGNQIRTDQLTVEKEPGDDAVKIMMYNLAYSKGKHYSNPTKT